MTTLIGRFARHFVCLVAFVVVAACSSPTPSGAAPYAAIVQDARTGEVLFSENANTRLHPASLTKMMTLYIAFEEIERGNIGLDSMVTVSKNAASQPPSRLGLKAGQKIALRYLIRAAAIKSANDAASAIGDHISGNEAKFAARMTRTAKALGMRNTTFKNANGLTAAGHLSTAADMNLLGRRLFYDFPQYYNIFSRRTTDAGMAQVRNTNTRFLDAYKGADGIKTGYTVAAGFNLTGSAERNGMRIIATVFGGKSTANRNAKMAELLDLGFRKAPANAPTKVPPAPQYQGDVEAPLLSQADDLPDDPTGAAKTIRLKMAVSTSPRPMPRPSGEAMEEAVAVTEEAVDAISDSIAAALAEAVGEPAPAGTLDAQVEAIAQVDKAPAPVDDVALAELAAAAPPARPETLVVAQTETAPEGGDALISAPEPVAMAEAEALPQDGTLDAQAQKLAEHSDELQISDPVALVGIAPETVKPAKRQAPIFDRVAEATVPAAEAEPVVIRLSTSNARHWGIHLGKFNTRGEAERVLLKTQLSESATLNEGLRKVVQKGGGYQANFMGLTQDQADMACRRLQARAVQCFMMGP